MPLVIDRVVGQGGDKTGGRIGPDFMEKQSFIIGPEHAGQTLSAWLRTYLPGQSWGQVRRLIEAGRVCIGDDVCLDPARRLREGETVDLLARSPKKPHLQEPVVIRFLDDHLVVVEKPSGISTVRHPSERAWNQRRKNLSPTLEDIVPKLIALREGRKRKGPLPRLRVVQRLDKETSGLVVFARSVIAERVLGKQFRSHTVTRRYLAVVPGFMVKQRIESSLVRDRGDGRRGSTNLPHLGKTAITHVEPIEKLPGYSLLSCRLKTGRTHQIRIHLAEKGHPICGDKVYCLRRDGTIINDLSGAPRLALHAAELGFIHPTTDKAMHWTMPLPADLKKFLDCLKAKSSLLAKE
ncbi:MAG TPA: RluA family pseudouridine synthase, partial [Gemmataceae bacterium]|nr:RluA family pseudouridine synthase [Gemmataceae bacterium]